MAKKKIIDSGAEKRRIDPETVAKALGANTIIELFKGEMRVSILAPGKEDEVIVIPRLNYAEVKKGGYHMLTETLMTSLSYYFNMVRPPAGDYYVENFLRRACCFTIHRNNGLIRIRLYGRVQKEPK